MSHTVPSAGQTEYFDLDLLIDASDKRHLRESLRQMEFTGTIGRIRGVTDASRKLVEEKDVLDNLDDWSGLH